MDIFGCRIKNLIFFVLIIYFIPLVVGPRTPNRSVDCFNNIKKVFRIFTDYTHAYDNNLKKLFKYAVLYLRYTKPQEQGLLYDGLQGGFFNDEFSYAYYKFLANLFEKDRTTYSATEYCNRLYAANISDGDKASTSSYLKSESKKSQKEAEETAKEKSDADYIACHYSLLYFGFTAQDQEGITYAYSKIVLDDITSNRRFRNDMVVQGEKTYAENYLKGIANGVTVVQNYNYTPYMFCFHIEEHLPTNK